MHEWKSHDLPERMPNNIYYFASTCVALEMTITSSTLRQNSPLLTKQIERRKFLHLLLSQQRRQKWRFGAQAISQLQHWGVFQCFLGLSLLHACMQIHCTSTLALRCQVVKLTLFTSETTYAKVLALPFITIPGSASFGFGLTTSGSINYAWLPPSWRRLR